MRVLSKKTFKDIQPLLPDNYAMILSRLKVKDPRLAASFATYNHLSAANSGQWSTDADSADEYRPLSLASADERDLVAGEITRIAEALKACRLHPQSEKLMEVPEEGSIFFRVTPEGEVKVILAEWGFRSVGHSETLSTVNILMDRGKTLNESQVSMELVWSDASIIADTPVTVEVYKTETPFTTDAQGCIFLGKVNTGQTVTVKLQSGESKLFSVDKRKGPYKLIFPWMVIARVTAVDENDNPVETELMIDGRNYATDKNGHIELPEMLLTPDKKIAVKHISTGITEFLLMRDSGKNDFKFPVPPVEKEEIITEPKKVTEPEPEPEPVEVKVSIRVIGKKGNPLVYTPVRVNLKKGYEETVTDADGRVFIEREAFTPGEKVHVRVLDSKKGSAPKAPAGAAAAPAIPPAAPAAAPAIPPAAPAAGPAIPPAAPAAPTVPPAAPAAGQEEPPIPAPPAPEPPSDMTPPPLK